MLKYLKSVSLSLIVLQSLLSFLTLLLLLNILLSNLKIESDSEIWLEFCYLIFFFSYFKGIVRHELFLFVILVLDNR